MPNVNASVMIEDAERMIGWDISQLELQQQQMGRQAFSLALQELWESWWWADLMASGQFVAAVLYAAGTAFNAGDTCYFPGTQKFYQAMQATTGNAPAIYTTASGSYTVNYAYWQEALMYGDAYGCGADASQNYGADYIVGINDTGLTLGAVVRNPTDGNYYSLYAYSLKVVVAGAGVTAANQTYTAQGTYGGKPGYVRADGAYVITWLSGQIGAADGWCIAANGGNDLYYSTSTVATPDLATNWY
jgi:hypothetical protein